MSDLDDKIREIVGNKAYSGEIAINGAVNQIKQAFTDDIELHRLRGYEKAIEDLKANYMTGRAWYDRFVKEFVKLDNQSVTRKLVYEAAKRAAGIEDAK